MQTKVKKLKRDVSNMLEDDEEAVPFSVVNPVATESQHMQASPFERPVRGANGQAGSAYPSETSLQQRSPF